MLCRRLLVIVLAAGALLATLVAAPASAATDPINWGAPATVDTQPPWGDPGFLEGISCTSTQLCVAVSGNGHLVSTTNPTGGTSAWQITSLPGVDELQRVSCADGPFCVALGVDFNFNPVIATSSAPTGGASAWSVSSLAVSSPVGVSCASSTFCALVDRAGNVWTSSTPASAGSWTGTDIDGSQPLTAISCPSTSLCVATDQRGDAIYSTDPTGATPTWTAADVAGSNRIDAVSCLTTGACWIADGQGNVWHSNGSAYSSAWTSVTVGDLATDGGAWTGISCSTASCAAVNGAGHVAASDNPTSAQASDWTVQAVDSSRAALNVSCLPTSCVGVDTRGNALTAGDPTGTWTTTSIDGTTNLDAVSCPSASLCVADDDAGAVVSSTDPAGGAGAWHRALVDSSAIDGISCPSVSLCVAGDDQGRILTSADPAGGAGAWTSPEGVSTHELISVSCPAVSLCVAVEFGGGHVWTSTNPTGGAGAWSSASIDSGPGLWAVSCPTVSLCVAVDTNGNVLTSTDPVGGASAWSAPVSIDPRVGLEAVSCASTTLCVAVDNNGNAFVTTDPTAGPWVAENIDSGGDGFSGVSCRPGPACVAVDFSGNVVESTDPAGGASTWSAPRNIDGGGANGFNAVNCSPGLFCVAVDDLGSLVAGTPVPPSASAPTSPVVSAPAGGSAPSSSTRPTISGAAIVGHRLRVLAGTWAGTPPLRYAFQWQACRQSCTNLAGATGSTYMLRGRDVGARIRVALTAVNALGAASAVSAAAGPVVTVRQLRSVLLGGSVPHGRAARYATIVAGHGFALAFAGLVPGRLRVVWKSGRNVLATGTLRMARAGRNRLRLKLTNVGQRLLRAHARGLAAQITFTPAGAGALDFSETFSLR